MPRLLLFAPCDNVLMTGDAQSASLIIVLTQINFQGPFPDNMPPNPLAPMRWSTFSQWEMSIDEVGIRYTQKVRLMAPDGTEIHSNVVEFTGEQNKPIHRIVTTNFGFPVIPEGAYRLVLSLERSGHGDWSDIGDYPLQIVHVAPVAAPTE
jgi:hypothetical protein